MEELNKEIKASGMVLKLYDCEGTFLSKTAWIMPDPRIHIQIEPHAYSAKTAFTCGKEFDEERRKAIEANKEKAKPITY